MNFVIGFFSAWLIIFVILIVIGLHQKYFNKIIMEIGYVITAIAAAFIGFIFGFVYTRLMQEEKDKEIFERIEEKVEKKIKDKNDDNDDYTNEYYVEINYRNPVAIYFDEMRINNLILQNNKRFEVYNDFNSSRRIVRCKNKPMDHPFVGLSFIKKDN